MATDDKYDRQLRLWGPQGQRALMNAHILLISADATGSETLKNLVLPGVGQFTILDDAIVSSADLGNNFFVDAASLGKPRANTVAELLCEMNPDVRGYSRVASLKTILDSEGAAYFSQFSLVIASNQPEMLVLPMSEILRDKAPLIVIQSYGLLGSIRLQYSNHEIIESRPENGKLDLRIVDPFPDLVEYVDSFQLDGDHLDDREHGHVPYIVILCKALQQWKAAHGGNGILSLSDDDESKAAFKKLVASMARSSAEENFDEALREAYRAYVPFEVPYEVQQLLEDDRRRAGGPLAQSALPESSNSNGNSSSLQYLIRALRLFMEANEGRIPLAGKVPDLTSMTSYYVRLQEAYQRKAAADKSQMQQFLTELLGSTATATTVSSELLDLFCENVVNVRRISTRSIAEEWNDPAMDEMLNSTVAESYDDPAQTPILWYLSLRAAHAFFTKFGRWPGTGDRSSEWLEADADEVWILLQAIAANYSYQNVDNNKEEEAVVVVAAVSRDHAMEITRFAAGELHVTASLVGGIASQEAVKLITKQYVPINNTYIYNGVCGCGARYEL